MSSVNDEVKMRILLAAKKLFASKGFYETSVRAICKEADVHIMMLAYNFQRKENVLSALFQVFLPVTNITAKKDLREDPVTQLKMIIREVVEIRINDPEIISILQHEITLPNPRNEIMQFIVRPIWLDLEEQISKGKAAGLFQYDSLDVTMIFIFSALLMSQDRGFLKNTVQDPMLGVEVIAEMMSEFILSVLKYSWSV